jgi:C4-type Zn-finger protein
MTLKSLAEHNDEVLSALSYLNSQHPNGIACPKCGAELYDSEPNVVLTSNPPQYMVACSKCDYRGTRF